MTTNEIQTIEPSEEAMLEGLEYTRIQISNFKLAIGLLQCELEERLFSEISEPAVYVEVGVLFLAIDVLRTSLAPWTNALEKLEAREGA